jgi:hypothetical protein
MTSVDSSTINAEANLTFDGSTLAVTGAITATGDITAFSSSDERLKENKKILSDALAKVISIGGYEFDWIEMEGIHINSGHDIGVIAQEMLEVLPEVVQQGIGDDTTLSVAYGNIVGVLIEAIKELKREIEELKK